MSTFNGIVDEFPQIRIDFFRASPDRPAPLACFLSHIHSDHLQGLESLRSPYVYCSSATRNLLLQLEKYPNRINFARGILESRKQHYKHLKTLLRPIALNCPTEVELGSRRKIRVTLFDANHCPGAVMFLIEGDGKAVLYTGDIRAELWWVNQLARNPVLIPYTLGERRLDRVYLDTTFAAGEDVHRNFPSKAEGLHELLAKIQKYPPQTVFHFRAWTLGYEEVWQAMSALLSSQVHVDGYQLRLYGSLSTTEPTLSTPEAPMLNGFPFGNGKQDGCLTTEQETRLHSCEPGTDCHTRLMKMDKTVWIFPIILRTPEGTVVPEMGAGGGGGDLYQVPELDTADIAAMTKLEELCSRLIEDPDALQIALQRLLEAKKSRSMRLSLDGLEHNNFGDYSVADMVSLLASRDFQEKLVEPPSSVDLAETNVGDQGLPNVIRFPYSRHSSHSELRHLICTLRPKDIYPCTCDMQTWTEEHSMETLFGDLCSERQFLHDLVMRKLVRERHSVTTSERKRKRYDRDDKLVVSDIESTQCTSSGTAKRYLGDDAQSKDALPGRDSRKEVRFYATTFISAKEDLTDCSDLRGDNLQIPVEPALPLASNNHPAKESQNTSALESYTDRPTSSSSLISSPPVSPNTRLRNIKDAYDRLKESHTIPQTSNESFLPPAKIPQTDGFADAPSPSPSHRPTDLSQTSSSSSQLTLSTSCFDSDPCLQQGPLSDTESPPTDERPSRELTLSARRAAYRAARTVAVAAAGHGSEDGYSAWEMFATTSGGNSHTEPEVEL